ncbi:macrophage mannose receptor 1-like [Astyanax mexicanus]|uniref:Macrophage mannose receptor 1-like n=1 Tax=Astyanax mexicanus TaxID=7994 RepID=A0A8T2LQL0_ASTMX|nr:macrophage mannose receptor 1-like [Astyanax mexicanus]
MIFFLLFSALCTIPFTLSEVSFGSETPTTAVPSSDTPTMALPSSNTTITAVSSVCQNGWSQFESRCFRVFTSTTNWAAAEQNCVAMGGHLASVHSSEEYAFMLNLLLSVVNSAAWIGGTDAAQEGVWVWTDGSAFNYTYWESGQPDNFINIENCMMMNWGAVNFRSWNDAQCQENFPSVCAQTYNSNTTMTTVPSTTVSPTTVPLPVINGTSHSSSPEVSFTSTTVPSSDTSTTAVPPSNTTTTAVPLVCQNGWSRFGSRCFRVFTSSTTWTASEQNCVAMGGHLASVHSSEEYTFILNLLISVTNNAAWIGGTDAAQEGVWVWTDGSAFNYSNWYSLQPDNYLNVENCILINWGGGWNDGACYGYYPSVCAQTLYKSNTTTTTVSHTTVSSTSVPVSVINGTSRPSSPENVMVMRLKVNSMKDLLAANNSQILLQQIKGMLTDGGIPNNATLHLRSINRKLP